MPPWFGPAHKVYHIEPTDRELEQCPNKAVRAFSHACKTGAWPLFIHGGVGTGKTCFALVMLDHCRAARKYRTLDELAYDFAAVMKGDHPQFGAPRGFWNDWAKASLVALDEIGIRENVSDHQYATLKLALDRRYKQPTILISNLSIDEISTRYDDRIASRMAQGTLVKVEGRDRRIICPDGAGAG